MALAKAEGGPCVYDRERMRLAWFRPHPGPDSADDLALVIEGLRATHAVHLVDARAAHDFVWQAAQGMFDLCVYELDDTLAHQYIWPYVLHYPGVLALRTSRLHESRAISLTHQHRDADREAEMAFADGQARNDTPWLPVRGGWSTWRIPVLASRVTAVADDALAAAVSEACPDARVVVTPTGVPDPLETARGESSRGGAVRVLVCDGAPARMVERAAARAREAGAGVELAHGGAGEVSGLLAADVIVATRWPTLGRPLVAALLGAAAGKVVIVAETASTARWPLLDPQTWQPRSLLAGPGVTEAPIAISIDPRDEEHSLMLALVRLSGDAELRASLGRAAREWWQRHATVANAVTEWHTLLEQAARLQPLARPAGWPPHLDAAGDGTMRAILDQFGIDHGRV